MTETVTAEPAEMSDVEAVDAMAAILEAEERPETEEQVHEETHAEADDQDDEAPDQEDEEESDEEPEEASSEELEIRDIEALAEAMGATPEEVAANLMVEVKVNGETSKVPLAEAIKGYQLQSDYSRKTAELGEQRRQLAELQTVAQNAAGVLQVMYQGDLEALNAQKATVNWEELRATDPAEWSARLQEFQQAEQYLAQKYQQAYQRTQENQRQAMEQQQQQLAEVIRKGNDALAEKIPEWTSEEVRNQDQAEMRSYLSGIGFNPQEIATVVDPRIVQVVRDAWKFRQMQASKPDPSKKTQRKVRLLKPGSRKTQVEVKGGRVNSLINKARKSQSDDDWAAALAEKLELN